MVPDALYELFPKQVAQSLIFLIENLQVQLEAHLPFRFNLGAVHNPEKLPYALVAHPKHKILRYNVPIVRHTLPKGHPVDQRRVITVGPNDYVRIWLDHPARLKF